MKFYKVAFKLTIICLISVHIWALKSDQIIGDDSLVINNLDYGYHVTIINLNAHGTYYLCGGTIIREQYAVTAAHCLRQLEWAKELYVVPPNEEIDTTNEEALLRYYKVVEAYVNDDFQFYNIWKNVPRDIGVVKIEGQFLNENFPSIKTLRLPGKNEHNFVDKVCTFVGSGQNIMGFDEEGKLSMNNGISDRKLRATKLKVVQREKIDEKDLRLLAVLAEGIEPFGLLSYGDSGGGLVYNDEVLVGVFSTSRKYLKDITTHSYFVNIWYYGIALNKIMDGELPRGVDKKVYTSTSLEEIPIVNMVE